MTAGKSKRINPDVTGAVWTAAGVMLAGFVFLVFLSLKPSKSGEDIAAIFPPSMSLEEITSISIDLPYTALRTGWLDNIVIFRPEPGASLDDLKSAGALLVVSAVMNGGCAFLTSNRNKKA